MKYLKNIKNSKKYLYLAIIYTIFVSFIHSLYPLSIMLETYFVINKKVYELIFFAMFILLLYIFDIKFLTINYNVYKYKISMKISNEIKENISKNIFNCKTSFALKSDKFNSWNINDIEQIQYMFIENIFEFINSIFTIIIVSFYLIYINYILIISSIILTLIMIFIPKLYLHIYENSNTKYNTFFEKYLSMITNLFDGFNILYFSNNQDKFKDKIIYESIIIKNTKIEKEIKKNRYNFLLHFTKVLSNFTINAISYILILFGKINFSTILGIYQVFNLFNSSIISLINILSSMKIGISVLDNIFSELKTENIDNSNLKTINKINKIEFKNVSLSYENKAIFNNINFTLFDNNIYCIQGPSGSGKSTLAKMLTKIETVYKGDILINGINIKEISNYSLFNLIDYIPESTPILNSNIYDNITLFSNYDKEYIDTILNLLNLSNINDVSNISTGQKQRLSIARALFNNKDIIILDESLDNIDKNNRFMIENILLDKFKFSIHISHHLSDNILSKTSNSLYLK